MSQSVAILGASKDKSRYSNIAQKRLVEKGYVTVPINPKYDLIDGIKCYSDLASYTQHIDTITVYVRPRIISSLVHAIIKASPKRVIFNPGTEDLKIIKLLENAGICVQIACTLVLLSTSQF